MSYRAFATTLLSTVALLIAPVGAAQAAGPAAWGSRPALVTDGQTPGTSAGRAEQLSADGRYVSFSTYDVLVAGDTDQEADVYVRDVVTGGLRWVSIGVGGAVPDGHSSRPAISASGRYVAYISDATNLVADDTNGFNDVFLCDLVAGTTVRVNVSSLGAQADLPFQDRLPGATPASGPSVSDDGTVAFTSPASNLVAGDTNRVQDVFVHSVRTGATVLASLTQAGRSLAQWSDSYVLSDDARCVAFTSPDGGVTGGDDNVSLDVFVRDLVQGTTRLVSAGPAGRTRVGRSWDPSLSSDCSTISFTSAADLLAQGDAGSSRVYVRDLRSGTTVAASLGLSGVSGRSTLSGDGTLVAYQSTSAQVPGVPADAVARSYVRDLTTGTTQVLVAGPGARLPLATWPVISADGSSVTVTTGAALVPADVDAGPAGLDVYVVRRDRSGATA